MSLCSHVFLSFSQELDRTRQLLNEKELDNVMNWTRTGLVNEKELDMTGLVNEKELGRTRHELDNHSSCERTRED